MNMQCQLCNNSFEIGRLQIHLLKTHKINIEEYYLQYINKDVKKNCPTCNKPTKFIGFKHGYSLTCGNISCRSKYINITYKEKQKEGCRKRNKEWKNEIIDGKTKQQIIIESGSEIRKIKQPETSKKISTKLKEKDSDGLTCISRSFLNRLNVTNPMKIPENVLKLRNTFQKKWNVDWITQSKEIKEKSKETTLNHFNVTNYAKSQKAKDSMLIRYKEKTIFKILEYFRSNNLSLLCDISEIYKNEKSNLKFKCNKCQTEYEKCWNDIMSWWMCRKCNPFSNSSYEEELKLYLANFNTEIISKYQNIKNPITGRMLEIDLYLPELQTGIEFDGLYWHSNEHQLNDNYHINKTELANKQNINLIHIFEDEWILKKNIVLSRISNILNLPSINKIYARKCIIKTIDFDQKRTFLEKNHIQGNDISCINLGLFYNDNLVSVMTFSKGNISKGHIQKDNIYELSRFCNLCFYKIPGAASKLLNFFKHNYTWNEIFSYADRRWSNGNLYYKLGFELNSIIKPNYWYMNKQNILKRIHRFSYRKSILKNMKNYDENLTEQEIMKKEGFIWIYDCGNLKFIMKNK